MLFWVSLLHRKSRNDYQNIRSMKVKIPRSDRPYMGFMSCALCHALVALALKLLYLRQFFVYISFIIFILYKFIKKIFRFYVYIHKYVYKDKRVPERFYFERHLKLSIIVYYIINHLKILKFKTPVIIIYILRNLYIQFICFRHSMRCEMNF